jgi:nitroreductase
VTEVIPLPSTSESESELRRIVQERHSIRMFLRDKPVPRDLLDEALELAMRAPSNSNIQPWRLFLATGPRRDRLVEALLERASAGFPATMGIPEGFAPLRRQLGALVYGSMGIARQDAESRRIAQLRNWEFFRAPVAGVVCMHRDLGLVDSLGVGMFLQTLVLALTERGLGTCVQVSIAHFPDVLREQLDIPDELRPLCGLAVGYPDPEFAANQLRIPRNPVDENVVFLEN